MNAIFELILEQRGGNYCHAMEVSDVHELESVAEQILFEFHEVFSEDEIIEFLETMSVYYLGENEKMENEVYEFSFRDYLEDTL
jgi:hypothetical protein